MRAESVATDALRNTTRSPLRDVLGESIRSKYLNPDDSHSRQFDETSMKIRDLESFKI
jgi:hypothetical protein